MKRSAPPKRKTPLKRKRTTPRRSSRRHDPSYLAAVRGLPCCARTFGGSCAGPIEAHHMGARGLGQKCSDDEAVPFCKLHHACWHDCVGPFLNMGKAWRAEFARVAISGTRAVVSYLIGPSLLMLVTHD